MQRILSELEPKVIFKYFEDITRIPRESGNEKMISDFLMRFADKHNLKAVQEDSLNVIIEKPASPGYENAPRVILQGHMDMVCVKNSDIDFDFEKDPIPVVLEGDTIKTMGTTLGADNGIAVAMILAILESKDIKHPPLSALITTAEETGMFGAVQLNPKNVSGEILINLDSEEEGTALSSCAGGVNALVHLPVIRENIKSEEVVALKIKIEGLLGGHSGIEINKNRANAIRLMGRTLNSINKKLGSNVKVADISGGEKMNAIAKHSSAVVVCERSKVENIKSIISVCESQFKNEFKNSDPDISILFEEEELCDKVFDNNTTASLITLALLTPNGVQTMSSDIDGLVESSNNIGVLTVENNEIVFNNAVRSSVKSLKYEITDRIKTLADICEAKFEYNSDYPEWEYRSESSIRDIMKEVYKGKYDTDLKIDAIHAGLECGILKEKVGDIDMISIGPNMYDVHTPKESLSVSSTRRVFEFLCEVLEKIN